MPDWDFLSVAAEINSMVSRRPLNGKLSVFSPVSQRLSSRHTHGDGVYVHFRRIDVAVTIESA